jgi:hypothetical protein
MRADGFVLACLLGCVALGSGAGAARADEAPAPDAGEGVEIESPHDPVALEVAQRMADALAAAETLRVTMDVAWDAVQDDGQTVEFGATRRVAIRRPDRARMEVVDRDGTHRRFVYDGRQVGLADDTHGLHATAPFSGDLDAMLAFVREELGLPTPLAELLSPDLYDRLAAADASAWAGTQVVDGVACDQVTFRGPGSGVQLWVPREGEPLPRRIVITYEDEPGQPQFRASLRDWDRSPVLEDGLFEFAAVEGSERIFFRRPDGLIEHAPGQGERP